MITTGQFIMWSASPARRTSERVHDIGVWIAQADYRLDNDPFSTLPRISLIPAGQRERWSLEALPLAGGWLGNMLTQGQIGGFARFGYNMPDDFGPTFVRGMDFMPPPRRDPQRRPKSDWGFSVYGGVLANLVLRDITLDGTTFEDSPSVDKVIVPAAGVGVIVGNRRFQVSFTYVFLGKEFEGQQDYSKFGALALSYFF
jgi:hypothetical protein